MLLMLTGTFRIFEFALSFTALRVGHCTCTYKCLCDVNVQIWRHEQKTRDAANKTRSQDRLKETFAVNGGRRLTDKQQFGRPPRSCAAGPMFSRCRRGDNRRTRTHAHTLAHMCRVRRTIGLSETIYARSDSQQKKHAIVHKTCVLTVTDAVFGWHVFSEIACIYAINISRWNRSSSSRAMISSQRSLSDSPPAVAAIGGWSLVCAVQQCVHTSLRIALACRSLSRKLENVARLSFSIGDFLTHVSNINVNCKMFVCCVIAVQCWITIPNSDETPTRWSWNTMRITSKAFTLPIISINRSAVIMMLLSHVNFTSSFDK